MSVAIFLLLVSGVRIRAYRDLSRAGRLGLLERPLFFAEHDFVAAGRTSISAAAAAGRWRFAAEKSAPPARAGSASRLDEAQLAAGDTVVISSLGGDVGQSIIMGEIIRARGLVTAVGTVDAVGPDQAGFLRQRLRARRLPAARPVLASKARGWACIGFHGAHSRGRSRRRNPARSPATMLSYLTRMGISASVVVEAMSRTSDIRWLNTQEAVAMNLITDPICGIEPHDAGRARTLRRPH